MNETPKKVVRSDVECFLCSTLCHSKDKILVFGRSNVNISSHLGSALDIDLSDFSQSANLFVCRQNCFKLIVKLKSLKEKYEDLKKEIKSKYRTEGQSRTKRLHREEDGAEQPTLPAERVSVAKSLFKPPTTCISYSGLSSEQSTIVESNEDPSYLVFERSLQDNPPQRAQSSQASPLVFTPTFVGGITSTPGPSSYAKSSVRISINHPSKTVNKNIDKTYEALGKSLFYGPPSRIATAVINCEPVRKEVIRKVLTTVSKEVNSLCSRREPSMLKKCSKEDLLNFNLQSLCSEWQQRAPLFYSFLLTCACKKSKDNFWLPSIAVSGSILLKERNPQMNATATILGILLKSRSIEANLSRLAKMKVTCANRTVLAKLDCIGENHTSYLSEVKQQISKENIVLHEKHHALSTLKTSLDENCTSELLESISYAHKELESLKKSTNPGFIIAFDNIDMQLKRKSMTMTAQNRNFHWVNHKMIANRVSGSELPSESPKSDILEVPNIKFFPSLKDHQQQHLDYTVLVSRVLVEYFDAFEPLKSVCLQHIPHKYTKEMSQKSSKVPLGVIFKNENVNEDMMEILKKFQTYLPQTADGGFDAQLVAGDQLSVERAVNMIASVANGYTPEDRLEGLNLQLGDWHAGVKLLTMIYKRFFSGSSEVDTCTLYSDRTVINRRNVKSDPKESYRPNRDFLEIVLKSRVIAAAMKVLGLSSKHDRPVNYALPLLTATKSQKQDYLISASAAVVDEFIFRSTKVDQLVNSVFTAQEREDIRNSQRLTEDGKFPCRFPGCTSVFVYDGKSRRKHEATHDPPPEVHEQPELTATKPEKTPKKTPVKDDVYNYNCALLQEGFLFLNFLDAVREGDGPRIIRQYKYIMLYCIADESHSTKYALESLYQFFLIYALLTPRDSERFIWNRSVNNHCKIGTNIPLDLDVEHSNNFIKQAIKNLGPNVTDNAISRISNAESATRTIITTVDETILKVARSGRHSLHSPERDLKELLQRVLQEDVFHLSEGRTYIHYCDFQRDRLDNLDISKIYEWLNKHKKNIDIGIRAR